MGTTDPTAWPTVVALSGDPRIGSATARAARRAAGELARTLADEPTVVEIDLANVSAREDDLRRAIRQARALVVATPDADGWASGALLDFLGGFCVGCLGAVPTQVIVTSADEGSARLAAGRLERYLRELGADPSIPAVVLDADGAIGLLAGASAAA